MTGALRLRQLCERDRDFLKGRDVDVFLGRRSGACHALEVRAGPASGKIGCSG
jgi:hypothetical protein